VPQPAVIDLCYPLGAKPGVPARGQPVARRFASIRDTAATEVRSASIANWIASGDDAISEAINGDLSVRVTADTTRMEWAPSPSGSVWRKRVYLVGPAESGQVTSVVRYEPDSSFPAHDHPDGEEILVLEGVFSDEHGDWPAGTLLLNPEGFRHAPYSRSGCILFVKLRQFPGRKRRHVVLDTQSLTWESSETPAVAHKPLYQQAGFSDVVRLERWEAEADLGTISYEQGAELFVLEGEFTDELGTYAAGCWLRLPVGSEHRPRSSRGCILYVKRSGLRYLRSVAV
jgi:anti-sigma factor ChrR (cupin superfamily)